jgi:splicing factor 3B subunit 2
MHWSSKRKYLMGKRGYEKPPFELPQFIADTGITEIRNSQLDKDATKKNKVQQREKMQPKSGKIDIDYQVLHDAFFRHQVKPTVTHFGNLYYEGRELEVKLKAKRPGNASDELKRSLGMTDLTSPPPWLFNMQRFGPPPMYPNLKVPGVNHPIPPGARYGFGPGEWGKPPVDEYGRPLYGDVFGTAAAAETENEGVDKTLWAEMAEEEEEEEEDEDEEEEEENEDEDGEDEDMESGMESASSLTTSGMETPESLQLRKGGVGDAEDTTSEASAPKALYTVLDEKKANVGASSLFGSQHTYVIPKESDSEKRVAAAKSKAQGAVDVALNPEDLESLDAVTLKRKYEAQLEAETVSKEKEDVSDIVEENRLKKRKTAGKNDKKKGAKYKF